MNSSSAPHSTGAANIPLDNLKNVKKTGWVLILILFFVFFEDFFRMVFPVFGVGWLLVKDFLLILVYVVSVAKILAGPKPITFLRASMPLLGYFLVTIIVYLYSAIAHVGSPSVFLVGARVDMFYFPLVFIICHAFHWDRLPTLFFRLFVLVASINVVVAIVQFFTPNLLAGIPGFCGLHEEGLVLHEAASFHDMLLYYVFGLFSDVGKFSRNLFHIFIWLWVLHLVFNVGRVGNVLIMSMLIGFVLILSGKRVPIIMWFACMFALPFLSQVATTFCCGALKKSADFFYIRSARNKFVVVLLFCIFGFASLAVSSEKARSYGKFVLYALSHQVQERFFGDDSVYFWSAELNRVLGSEDAVYGQGAGTSTMGVHYVISEDEYALAGYRGVEHGPLKVWLEFGVLGIVQMILLWGGIFVVDMIVIIKMRLKPRWLVAALLIATYHLMTLAGFFVGHQYWDDAQGLIHFWLITGVQLCLCKWGALDRYVPARPCPAGTTILSAHEA